MTHPASDFTDRLGVLLRYSDKAYTQYLQGGKKFVFAQVLYSINEDIRVLLGEAKFAVEDAHLDDVLALLFHIEVWQHIWNDEAARQSPGSQDAFVFENEITFPRDSVARLLSDQA